MTKFEQAVCDRVRQVREQLQQLESLHSFNIEIKAEGRVHDGEVKITFGVGAGTYSADVHSHSLSAAISEFMRRHGWIERNLPLMLTYEDARGEEPPATLHLVTDEERV